MKINQPRHRIVACMILAVLATTGCGERGRSGGSSASTSTPPPPADYTEAPGRWVIDMEPTLVVSRKQLASALKTSRNMDTYIEGLSSSSLDFTIKDDGTFICLQETPLGGGTFSGTYTIDGLTIRLEQTHADQRLESDLITGIFRDGKLDLLHVQGDTKIPYVLKKVD